MGTALVLAIVTMAAQAQSAASKLRTAVRSLRAVRSLGKCEEALLRRPTLERQKAGIQEFKKQRDGLNKMQPNAGVKSDTQADPTK
jgi:hypothetical protein